MTSAPYDVVILPSPELAERATLLSSQLARKGVLFTLRDGAFYPHISLYMLQLKATDLDAIKQYLAEIAEETSSLNLTASKYWQAKQFFDAEYEKSDELSQLQINVVTRLNPIRDGMRTKDVERMKEATGIAFTNLKDYGWSTIGELYRPHLTVTRFTADQDLASLTLPPIQEFVGEFSKLGLFEMGDNNTCVRKIAEFNLKVQ